MERNRMVAGKGIAARQGRKPQTNLGGSEQRLNSLSRNPEAVSGNGATRLLDFSGSARAHVEIFKQPVFKTVDPAVDG